jgi:hypothetical protein
VRPPSLLLILCPERSGSTLLSMMLGGHERVLAPPEMHLLRYPDYATWRRSYPQAIDSLAWLAAGLGLPSAPGALEARYGGMGVGEVYEDLMARCPPGVIVVDKTPAYARDDEVLARAERLRPRYVWLLRHPLGVAASLMDRYVRDSTAARRWAAPWRLRSYAGATRAERLALRWRRERFGPSLDYWCETHGRIGRFLARLGPERSAKVHYEDLVREPERAVGGLCRWLGIEPSPAMLRPWENLPDGLGWGIGDGKLRGTRAIQPERAEAWRRVFDEGELGPEIRGLMDRLGVARAAAADAAAPSEAPQGLVLDGAR